MSNTGNTDNTDDSPWQTCEPVRTVTPRSRTYRHMFMVSSSPVNTEDGTHHELVTEEGEYHAQAADYFADAEPTIVITLDASSLLAHLHQAFGEHPGWRYTMYKTHSDYGDKGSVSRVKLTTFGFRGPGFRKQRLHQCWDARSFSPDVSARFLSGSGHADLLAWATDVRSWARDNNLELRNAFAGYGAQLLRDPRFYPDPRRRVPRATNESVRSALPGNLITLHAPDKARPYTVTCVDQVRAHHRIVQELTLPSSNHLFARGYFNDPENAEEYWTRPGDVLYDHIRRRHHGLLYVELNTRVTSPSEEGLRLPLQDHQGTKRAFVWTNQLTFLESTGTQIEGVYAAWTSTSVDDGLSRYGKWAENQIVQSSPTRRQWLKPLLHSTYGLLAARPRPLEVGHNSPNPNGTFLMGVREFFVKGVKLDTVSPVFVNVVQRGMIEAETQLRSLRMARTLTDAGCKILHVHSDGLHVQGDLPLLPASWSVSELTDVIYFDRVSWVSHERVCLPGRDSRVRHEEVLHYGRLLDAAQARDNRTGRVRRYLQRTNR